MLNGRTLTNTFMLDDVPELAFGPMFSAPFLNTFLGLSLGENALSRSRLFKTIVLAVAATIFLGRLE